jgi:DNA-binding LacI/PurR family transcriptional regulator
MLDKPLTTVISPTRAIVENAMQLLAARLGRTLTGETIEPDLVTPMSKTLPTTLRIGATT